MVKAERLTHIDAGLKYFSYALIACILWYYSVHWSLIYADSYKYKDGIHLIFIPAGLRLMLILVIGFPAAIGIALGDFLLYGHNFGFDHFNLPITERLCAMLTISFVPYLTIAGLNKAFRLDTKLNGITIHHILVYGLAVSAAAALGRVLVYGIFDRISLQTIMIDMVAFGIGDFLGTIIVLVSAFVIIKILKYSLGQRLM